MALPTLTLLDGLERGESPLNNGGKWALIQSLIKIGEASLVEAGGYKSADPFGTGEDGAYWTPAEFSSPGIAFKINKDVGSGERYFGLWLCLTSPTLSTKSGYKLKLVSQATALKGKFVIEKITEGTPSTLNTSAEFTYAVGDFIAFQMTGTKLIAWRKSGAGEWAVVSEVTESSFTKGFVGLSMKGNLGRMAKFEAGSGALNKLHTLTASNGSAATTTGARTGVHTQSATQASSASKARALARVLSMVQAGSFGPQLPSTPLTDELESELEFNSGATWTVLAWAEDIGIVFQKNKGLIGKPKPVGWGGTELKKLGARYNATSFADPINRMMIREADVATVGRYAALGICVPSNGERSGYVARIENTSEGGALVVTLERWINGAKTVLAETTIEHGYFGAAATGKEAPFALTLVGGVLRLWLAKSLGTPTVLLSANDATFTSGYDTMESLGGWMLSQEHAATMDGQIALEGHPSKGHTQEATQGSSGTRGATQVLRTLAVGQASSPSFGRQITRSLTATQAATQTVSRAVARSFATTQGSSATRTAGGARSLVATQGQSISKRTEIARTLSLGVTQVVSKAVSLARSLSITQGQSATERGGLTRTLVGTQGSTATERASVTRTLIGTQAQAATRQTAPARAMVAASGASATFARAVARALRVGQPQTASQEGAVEGGAHDHPHTLSAGQGASAALQRALARRLTTGATVGASVAHSATRTLAASGGATAVVGRTPAVTLRGSSSSVAGLQHGTQVAALLSAMSSSSAHLRRAVARGLSTTTGSAAAVSFDTTEVPLPPPVNMAASSGTPQPTSEAVTPQGESSLGQSGLTSSVETTT